MHKINSESLIFNELVFPMMVSFSETLRKLAIHCFLSVEVGGKSEIAQVFKRKEDSLSSVGCVLAHQELTYSI